jgi:endonuclease YncB( thermonuclease family)
MIRDAAVAKSLRRLRVFAFTTLPATLAALPAAGKEMLTGPVAAEVIRAVDGDTIEVRATVWLDLVITAHVRIRGIDAPEVHGKCLRERDLAAAATVKLAQVAAGEVSLSNIEYDKYGGRVLADVSDKAGHDVGAELRKLGIVRPYDGGERQAWCGIASAN